MNYNENVSEALAKLYVLAPASQAAATLNGTAFSTANMRRVYAAVNIGSVGASGTVQAKFQAAATSGGTYADVPGSLTNVISASGFLELEVKAETLGSNQIGPWLRLVLIIGVNAVTLGAEVFGEAGYYPSSDYNVVTPAQTLVD